MIFRPKTKINHSTKHCETLKDPDKPCVMIIVADVVPSNKNLWWDRVWVSDRLLQDIQRKMMELLCDKMSGFLFGFVLQIML